MPIGRVNAKEDLDKVFNEQLQRLQFDHVDFYLLHGLNRDGWRKTLELNVLDWAEGQVAEGRINHLGFSFHDEFEIFKEIVDSYKWGFKRARSCNYGTIKGRFTCCYPAKRSSKNME